MKKKIVKENDGMRVLVSNCSFAGMNVDPKAIEVGLAVCKAAQDIAESNAVVARAILDIASRFATCEVTGPLVRIEPGK